MVTLTLQKTPYYRGHGGKETPICIPVDNNEENQSHMSCTNGPENEHAHGIQ
jgi:hypothetical protein